MQKVNQFLHKVAVDFRTIAGLTIFKGCFQPIDVLCHAAHPKRPVWRPKKSTSTDSTRMDSDPPPDKNSEVERSSVRGAY